MNSIRMWHFILIALISIWVRWIGTPWAITCAFVPVISGVVVAELTVEEWFPNRLFPRKKLLGAVRVEHLPISDGWDMRSSSKYVDSIRRAYEMIIFTELVTDVHHLVVEVISPTFC